MAQGAKFNMLLAVKTLGQQGIKRMGNSMQGLAGRVKNVKLTVDGLAKAYASLRIVQDALNVTVQRAESERRLALLSQGFDDLASVTNAATAASKKFGLSQTQANKEFAQIYARLRPIGLGLEDITTVYEGFNTAAKLSGTSSTEASGAFLQLSQALGTGVLRGEEFNSIFEQTPAIIQAIAKEMNKPVAEMRELAKQGKVTIDYILPALERLRTEGADKLAEAMKGPEQQFRNLRIATEELQIAAITDNLEKIISLVNGLTEATESLTNIINAPGFKQTLALLYKFSSGPLNKLNDLGTLVGPKDPPSLSDALGIENPEQTGKFIGRYRKRVNELKVSVTSLNDEWKKGAQDGLKKYTDGLKDISTRVAKMVTNAFQKMEDALVNFVTTGKLEIKSLVQSIISDLARLAIQQTIMQPLTDAFKSALPSLFGAPAGPAKANGGIISSPQRVLLGEAGESELVIPESKMDTAMRRYAKGARGSSILEGGDSLGSESGNLVGAGAIDVRFDVQRINAVDYVTSQQFEQGIRSATEQGARKGEQMTLRRLQTSPNTRKRIGV